MAALVNDFQNQVQIGGVQLSSVISQTGSQYREEKLPAQAKAASQAVVQIATTSLTDYICSGPLLSVCGFTPDQVHEESAAWEETGAQLSLQLSFDAQNLSQQERQRVYHYYLPIYFWLRRQLDEHKKKHEGGSVPALMVGISAPQGCGKTTLVEQLEELVSWSGQKAAVVSIDDFYLTFQEQTKLAEGNPGNSLLELRGNAGTHDLQLGTKTMRELRELRDESKTSTIPRYNKSAYGGRGDRHEEDKWQQVSGPVDVVIVEGWMLGFRPIPESEAGTLDSQVQEVNRRLQGYQEAWDAMLESWIVIRIQDPKYVFNWRLQAEEAMKAKGKAGMTAQQVEDFVSRFQPAYSTYLPSLYAQGPTTAQAGRTLIVEVDENRSPVANQPKPVL